MAAGGWFHKTEVETQNPLLGAQQPPFSTMACGARANALVGKRGSISGLGAEINPLGRDEAARRSAAEGVARIIAQL